MSSGSDEAATALMEQAEAQLTAGAFEEAVETFTAALALNPSCAEGYRGRASAKLQLKAWTEATLDFTRARDLNPDDQGAWVGLGMSLAMANKMYEAIDVFETLLSRHADSVRGHLQLGLLYYQLCVTAKGRQHLEAALACRPSLEERRLIQQVLREQQQLDRRRYYRPDFEALHRKAPGPFVLHWIAALREAVTRRVSSWKRDRAHHDRTPKT